MAKFYLYKFSTQAISLKAKINQFKRQQNSFKKFFDDLNKYNNDDRGNCLLWKAEIIEIENSFYRSSENRN